jgi:PAS domain S-box-containing protein
MKSARKTREEFRKDLEGMRLKFLELQQCRQEFQRVQKRYEQLLQSAPDAMVFVSREAKIVLVNAQLVALFGYTEEELIGRDLDTLIPERFRRHHRGNVARYFDRPHVRPMGSNLVIYGLRKDGTEFPADISLSPLVTEDELFAVGSVRDITERKKTEDEKQRLAQQLAEAERLSALGRITANVADEIRNPLTTIGGFARRLRKIADSEKEQNYAAQIISEVEKLEVILRDVLAFSRTRSLLFEDHDIRGILDEALKVREEQSRQLSVAIQRVYGDDAIVRVDRAHVFEALDRLIAHALHAMPKGGLLSVVTDRDWVKGVPYVRVKIQDTGQGIPAEKIERMFEPFFNVREMTAETGLTFSVVKRIVEEERGMISIESREGAGATVTLLFPDMRPA